MSVVEETKMKEINIILPHQLFEHTPLPVKECVNYLIEESLFFNQYKFHKQKLTYHRATMKFYQSYLEKNGCEVVYVNSIEDKADLNILLAELSKSVKQFNFIDPVDLWMSQKIDKSKQKFCFETHIYESPLFINSTSDLTSFFNEKKKKFYQTSFYIEQRKRLNILLEKNDSPVGGKWSFDTENRKKYPKKSSPPKISSLKSNDFYDEAFQYVSDHYSNNPGDVSVLPLYPISYDESITWLNDFLRNRFFDFGKYEDAILKDEIFLHHSVLTPMLNVGLLTPKFIINQSIAFANNNDIPINSLEGFVRQIIGWREFIRGIYQVKGSTQRTTNFFQFKRKIPPSFYDGTTGIEPLDDTIKKVLKTAYCHHIERLMILGNFMVLCEFDPDEVYRWFMELFIDAYDWVMVPNVYGMSQFSDGGLMATKPYISGSNYLRKMSNYKNGSWQEVWDALYWNFIDKNRDVFIKNIRMKFMVSMYDKMNDEKKLMIKKQSIQFLNNL